MEGGFQKLIGSGAGRGHRLGKPSLGCDRVCEQSLGVGMFLQLCSLSQDKEKKDRRHPIQEKAICVLSLKWYFRFWKKAGEPVLGSRAMKKSNTQVPVSESALDAGPV